MEEDEPVVRLLVKLVVFVGLAVSVPAVELGAFEPVVVWAVSGLVEELANSGPVVGLVLQPVEV